MCALTIEVEDGRVVGGCQLSANNSVWLSWFSFELDLDPAILAGPANIAAELFLTAYDLNDTEFCD